MTDTLFSYYTKYGAILSKNVNVKNVYIYNLNNCNNGYIILFIGIV